MIMHYQKTYTLTPPIATAKKQLENTKKGWWSGLALESTHLSCKGPEFDSWIHAGQLSVASNCSPKESSALFWHLRASAGDDADIHRHTKKNEYKTKLKNKLKNMWWTIFRWVTVSCKEQRPTQPCFTYLIRQVRLSLELKKKNKKQKQNRPQRKRCFFTWSERVPVKQLLVTNKIICLKTSFSQRVLTCIQRLFAANLKMTPWE